MPDFVSQDAVEAMRVEADSLVPDAVYFSQRHNPYFSEVPDDLPDWDPRRSMGRKTNGPRGRGVFRPRRIHLATLSPPGDETICRGLPRYSPAVLLRRSLQFA